MALKGTTGTENAGGYADGFANQKELRGLVLGIEACDCDLAYDLLQRLMRSLVTAVENAERLPTAR
jgi:hypothetical protein